MWKDNQVCQLQWTDGHVWQSSEPIVTSKPFFMYKYVLLDGKEQIAWEEGIDRIADLELIA